MRRTRLDWKDYASLEGFVRLVLLVDWDPIGIFGHSAAMNEYDGYALQVCALLSSGASLETLTAHLNVIEKERMGLPGDREDLAAIVAKLLQVHAIWRRDQDLTGKSGQQEAEYAGFLKPTE